jgi:hypothetical protein
MEIVAKLDLSLNTLGRWFDPSRAHLYLVVRKTIAPISGGFWLENLP